MTYIERKLGSWRSYEVTGRSIMVSGKTFFGTRFRTEIEHEKIKTTPDEVSVEDDTRTALVGAPGAVATLLGAAFGNSFYSASPILFYSILVGGVVAMIAGFLFGGRVKASVFKNRDEAVLFDVTERGNSLTQFEAFIAALRSQIQSAQR
jgi:membrane associated rhomboid family serine protease